MVKTSHLADNDVLTDVLSPGVCKAASSKMNSHYSRVLWGDYIIRE